jgi:FdhE protein
MQTQPIDFHPPAEEAAPYLLPVTATLFAERAERFARRWPSATASATG